MKEWQRWVGNHFLALIIGIIVGIATGILVGEYSLWRAEELKRIEKTVLKERMMRENEILEKRYKEDYELWLKQDSLRYIEAIDSINGHFSARGMGRSGARLKALQDYETKRNVRLKEKELEYKREVEDLKLKLDF